MNFLRNLHFKLSKWIESDGGPLILLEKSIAENWGGASRNHYGYSDYDRACSVEEYLRVVDIANAKALILNDEPFRTAGSQLDLETLLIIRWKWASSEKGVVDSLSKLPHLNLWTDSDIVMPLRSREVLIFDSAYKLSEVDDFLVFDLEEGDYLIHTLEFKPTEDIFLLLHLMRKVK